MKQKPFDDTLDPDRVLPSDRHDVDVKGITADSRLVRKNYLYAALKGNKFDGRDFIKAAVDNGAIAVLAEEGTVLPEGVDSKQVTLITDPDPRRRFAIMAANFYKSQPRVIAGVTGTNGKTSTVHFAAQLWQLLGNKSASLGTMGIHGAGFNQDGRMTTPDPVELHAALADINAAGITHLAMEASSHGLHQSRLDGVAMTVAAFTNITRDHLDYHGSMDAYLEAKAKLFSHVLIPGGTAVLNADLPEYQQLEDICKSRGQRVISFGQKGYEIQLLEQKPTQHGQDIKLEVMGKVYDLHLPLIGAFQAQNVLCALGLVIAEFIDDLERIEKCVKLLEFLKGVRGRVESVDGHPSGAAIFVDYAHTPDALENVLKATRPHTKGKLHVLFGCGGDRDKGKRPEMGRIAQELADVVIVTDDNPRSEKPAQIRKEILAACPKATEIGDRRQAILESLKALSADDVLIVAGKGHEQGQIIEGVTHPFDDKGEIQKAMTEL